MKKLSSKIKKRTELKVSDAGRKHPLSIYESSDGKILCDFRGYEPKLACILAAAPELLLALLELTNEVDANIVGTGANDPNSSLELALVELVENARKAIEKARGQE